MERNIKHYPTNISPLIRLARGQASATIRSTRRPTRVFLWLNSVVAILSVAFTAQLGLAQGIIINEYMTGNRSAIADEDGKYPDWFELYNNSFDALSMNGWTIDDHPSDTIQWAIPPIRLEAFQRLLFFASAKNKGQLAPFNETVVRPGDPCRYMVPVAEPELGWFWPDIDDSGWQRGRFSLGYGDGDDTTIVPATTSLYIRTDFQVDNVADLRYALLHVDYDDGFVAYVNGAEIARANVDGLPPSFDSTSIDEHEAQMYQGGKPEMFFVPNIAQFVRNGRNVLSIQVHNNDPASNDLSLTPFLTLGLNIAPANPRGVPDVISGFLLQMHTDFKLASNNDTLVLRNSAGTIIDMIFIDEMPADMSRGRAPDGSSNWRIFQHPTPGAPNPLTGGTIATPRPSISPPAGFYSVPVTVTLTNDSAQAQMFYTLDGSPPSDTSTLYTGAFRLDTSAVVRAIGIIPGELPGNERTSSFIVGTRPTLPVVSLSMNPDDLWNPETGIYVLGPTYDPEPPYRGANFWQNWERPVHVEMFETDGSEAVELDAGVKIHGGWTRSFPQKSMRVMARAKYGVGNIAYKIFPDRDITQFESVILRNGGSDWDHTIFRDGLLTGLMKDDYPWISAYRPSILYLNGAYWGILNMREQMNEQYVAARFNNINSTEVDAFEIWGEKVNGEWNAYTELTDFFNNRDLSDPANYRLAEDMIDVDEFVKYNAVNIYVDNGDWPGNNNRFFRVRLPGEKWHWFLLDLDFGFGLHGDSTWQHNSLADALVADGPAWPNPPYATLFLRKMCQSPVFRAKFINGMADLMNNQFHPDNVLRQMNEKKSALAPEIEKHLLRWNRNLAEWERKVAEIPPFARNRPAFMRQFVEQQFGLPGHATLSLNCNPPAGGDVKINENEIPPTGWSGIYFRTVPLTIEAIPQPGYRFVGWTGGSVSTNPRLTIALDNDRSITALFSLAPGIVGLPVINEINYNSIDSFDTGDWVELYAFNGEVDLSDWTISDEDSAHSYLFPIGTIIPPGEYLIVVEDTAKFDSLFPGVTNVVGPLGFGFGKGGDQVRVFSPRGELIDSVAFDDTPPWPLEADGLGSTLELRDPALPNEDSTSWRASLFLHGSPMASNQYNPPGLFQLLSPSDGMTVRTDSVLVSWSTSADNDPEDTVRYTVEWSVQEDFSLIFSATTLDTSYIIAENPVLTMSFARGTAGLPDRSKIYWRVRASDTQDFIRVATPGDSGWSFIVVLTQIPTEFKLQPIFPNPFNNRVWVTVDVPVAGEVEVAFYNLLGNEITSTKEIMQPGSHRFLFPPLGQSNLASGIYWVQARYGGKSKIAKMILVR